MLAHTSTDDGDLATSSDHLLECADTFSPCIDDLTVEFYHCLESRQHSPELADMVPSPLVLVTLLSHSRCNNCAG